MSKHGGCFYCGNTAEEILTSLQKQVIYPSGKQDVVGVALCSTCRTASFLDLRVKPGAAA